jgi:hypothetical protein
MENKIINLQVNDNINTTENSVKSLKAQLREAQNEVNVLSEKFGATSREAVQAAKQAAILKDRIGDAKNLTDAFNPDAKFRALTTSLSGVTGGFAAVQGGMALFGKESDDVQKTLLKVQAAMALSQGIQSVGESVDSFKQLGAVIKSTSLAQGVLTAATAAYNFVNSAATTGLKLFRAALISTGIGALVVGVGLLISNFDKVKTVILNLIPGLANVGKFIGGIVDSITDFVGATSDASRALDKLKKDADNTLAVNKKFMQEHSDQVDEYTKKKIDAKNAYATAVKEDGADQVALAKKLNRELADIEFSRGDEARKKQKEAAEKAAADRKSESERIKKEKEAEAKRLKEEEAKNVIADAEAYRNKLEEALKVEADAKKANADALLTEQQLAIQNENLAYQAKLDNAKRFGVSTEEIEKQHLNTLNNINLTAQQKQYAEDKANADALIKIEELKTQAKIEQAQRGAALLTNISDLIGKDTAAGKVAAVAATTINTYAAAQAAFLNAQKNPISILGPAYPYISAGLAIAGGLKNVQAILSVPTPSGGGGGSAPSGGGMGSAPVAPQFNVVGASSTSQLAQTIGNQQNTPVQAYVVSNDVTTAQALDRNIIKGASL